MTLATTGTGWPVTSRRVEVKWQRPSGFPAAGKRDAPWGHSGHRQHPPSGPAIFESSDPETATLGWVSQYSLIIVNSTPLPSGRQWGRRWLSSSFVLSGVVKASGFPPSAETLKSPTSSSGENTMLLSDPQLAPKSTEHIAQDRRNSTLNGDLQSACRLPRIPPIGHRVIGTG